VNSRRRHGAALTAAWRHGLGLTNRIPSGENTRGGGGWGGGGYQKAHTHLEGDDVGPKFLSELVELEPDVLPRARRSARARIRAPVRS
jgi:hypothetical protein